MSCKSSPGQTRKAVLILQCTGRRLRKEQVKAVPRPPRIVHFHALSVNFFFFRARPLSFYLPFQISRVPTELTSAAETHEDDTQGACVLATLNHWVRRKDKKVREAPSQEARIRRSFSGTPFSATVSSANGRSDAGKRC